MRTLKCIIYFSVIECCYLTFKNILHFCNYFRELVPYTSVLSAVLILNCYVANFKEIYEHV